MGEKECSNATEPKGPVLQGGPGAPRRVRRLVRRSRPRTAAGDVRNEQTYGGLVTLGGEDQVPFLVGIVRRVVLHESGGVIDYLDRHNGRPKAAR